MLVFNVEDVKVPGYPDVWGYIDVAVGIGVWLCLECSGLGLSAGRVLFFAKAGVDPDKWPEVFR